MIGIFTAAENRERLYAIERHLKRRDLSDEQRAELLEARDELRQWFMDLWRIEGGGA